MFKLVRIDDENHREIDLIDGKQVIGREQLFDCDDKRISRQHAELEVTVDSVSIKALHLNPCFFVKSDMTEAHIVKQNTSINGYHGDKIGFLPRSHWFLIDNVGNNRAFHVNENSQLRAIIDKILIESEEDGVNEISIETQPATVSSEEQNNETTERSTGEQIQAPNSPLPLSANNAEELTQCNQPCDNAEQSPNKRCFVKEEPVSPVEVKKVKTESEPEDVKPDINLPSTSNDSGASGDQPSPPSNQQNAKRERCMYGKDCYRRNPQHKARFSHPSDADYGTGPQAECPYGYACAKRDSRHWRDHSHPYGMHPPPPQGKKKRRARVDSPKQLIVTGKRARRPVTSAEAWSDSETDEDPYGTDDSDDWTPPSDIEESQDYSQTQ